MDEQDVLAERFEAHRNRLRAVAYQTLGSATEADDAVQEAWVRPSRTDPGPIETLMTFTIADGRIVAIDLIDDPGRIVGADLAILGC